MKPSWSNSLRSVTQSWDTFLLSGPCVGLEMGKRSVGYTAPAAGELVSRGGGTALLNVFKGGWKILEEVA